MLDLQNALGAMPHVDPKVLNSIQANPDDVSSPEKLVEALFDAYSAKAGERDWERLRSLFYPTVGLNMVIHPREGGGRDLGILPSHQDYRNWCEDMLAVNNLFEWEFRKEIRQWGHMAHVVASVAVADEPNGEPFGYAMQNIQLYWDRNRWWVVSILVDLITPDNPFPPEFQP